jgi:acyl-[acyl carrier protein]--UDP-N-acetylglucosamine O-acyltransferase
MYEEINGNLIHKTAVIDWDVVEIGTGNVIGAFSVIGEKGFMRGVKKFNGKVIIGDDNRFGNHVSIMIDEHKNTIIGNDCLFMNYVNIGHGTVIKSFCEIGCGTIIPGNVIIEDYCKIKIGSIIRNRITLATETFVAMGSVVVKDTEKGSSYMGAPARKR